MVLQQQSRTAVERQQLALSRSQGSHVCHTTSMDTPMKSISG